MNRKEIFRRNLSQRMTDMGLTEQELASCLGLDRYWRKWLRRLVYDGLARANAGSAEMLMRLSNRLGFENCQCLWSEDLDSWNSIPNPEKLAHVIITQKAVGNPQAAEFLADIGGPEEATDVAAKLIRELRLVPLVWQAIREQLFKEAVSRASFREELERAAETALQRASHSRPVSKKKRSS